jgi:CRP-like cAMP-binding protein
MAISDMIVIMSDALVHGLWRLTERKQELAAGDILFRAGHPVRSLFLVASGALRLIRALPHGLS